MNSAPLQLLDNFPYTKPVPPTASAFGDEIGRRAVAIMERLDFGNSKKLYDELLFIAQLTRFPLSVKKRAKKSYDFGWITDDDLDFLDWLIDITVNKSENNKTRCACIVASLYWALSRSSDLCLSPYLKTLNLNTKYADFLCSEYLKIFEM